MVVKKCEDCGDNVEFKKKSGKFCEKCRKARKAQYQRDYRKKHPEVREEYRAKNREKILNQMKDYVQKNKEKITEYSKLYQKKKLEEDPVFRLRHQIRCLVGGSLKRKGFKKNSKTEQILGCSILDFQKHIESLFKEGMSWENRNEWEIDHKIPISSGKTEAEVLKLNHYTNLQPLWTYENREKGDKTGYL